MVQQFLQVIIEFILFLSSLIVRIVTLPIYGLISVLIPDFSNFETMFNQYTYKILNGLAFAREVFLNVTGFPRPLLQLLITLFIGKLTFHIASIPIRFIINTYKTLKGGRR